MGLVDLARHKKSGTLVGARWVHPNCPAQLTRQAPQVQAGFDADIAADGRLQRNLSTGSRSPRRRERRNSTALRRETLGDAEAEPRPPHQRELAAA